MIMIRIGHGYDAHRLTEGRRLTLCGVCVPFERGLSGHSDADVAAHAVMDAILGAIAMGDIGQHFPDSDPAYQDADSLELLDQVVSLADSVGYVVGNIDITIIAQRPKLSGYIEQMRENIAATCGVDSSDVNVKATTTEGMGFEGAGEGISAHAVVLLYEDDELSIEN